MVARLAKIALGAACVLMLAGEVQARSPYDGNWSVTVFGQSGSCAGGRYNYELQIRNGNVYYYGGDAQVSGHVSGNGRVFVRVSSANGNGVGSGRLSRSSGGGYFRGATQSGPCAGTWNGLRTG